MAGIEKKDYAFRCRFDEKPTIITSCHGAGMAYLLVQLAQLMRQVPVLCMTSIDVTRQLLLLPLQPKQLLALLELLSLQNLQLFGHSSQPASFNLHHTLPAVS